MNSDHTGGLTWRKNLRYGCKTYAGVGYTAEKLLHQYNIDVFGTKSTGQQFILTIICAVPNTKILEYMGKSVTELKAIADQYHETLQGFVVQQKQQDVRSLFHVFRDGYRLGGYPTLTTIRRGVLTFSNHLTPNIRTERPYQNQTKEYQL